MRHGLLIAMILALIGCGTITNQYTPENTAEAPLAAGAGRIIFSTGAARGCVSESTYLKLLPEGASYDDKEIARFSVDSYALKSDFADHQGNLHMIAIPAGHYYLAPLMDNPVIHSVDHPLATLAVAAGETVYLGEYYMPEACTLTQLYEVHDQMIRDMELLKSKVPRFDTSQVDRRLMVLSGGGVEPATGVYARDPLADPNVFMLKWAEYQPAEGYESVEWHPLAGARKRPLFVSSDAPPITAADIESTRAISCQTAIGNSGYGVSVVFSERSALRMREMTRGHTDGLLARLLQGKALLAARVHEELPREMTLCAEGVGTLDNATRLARMLAGK